MPASSFEETVNALIASFKAKVPGGISWAEFLALLHEFIAAVMLAAEQLAQAGPTKKAMVLDAVGRFYDLITPSIVLPLPGMIGAFVAMIRPMIRPLIRSVVLKTADGILEGIFKLSFKPAA